MSKYWHGYIALQKPAAVSAEDWATALAALKTELDETPTASNPAQRWHTVTSGDTTIAEAMFDLSKLNTSNLTSKAGVDMTGAWEPLRPYQTKDRSMVKAHSLIDDRGWALNGYDQFVPASASIAHVQAAIDAAIANGGGEVDCTGLTVTLTDAGSITATLMGPNQHYGLIINGDNVGIRGGTFVLDDEESYTSPYTGILIGNGGGIGTTPIENGTWCYNNWLRDCTINGSALDAAARDAISTTITSYTALFAYCQDWYIRNVTVINGWGSNAMLGSAASSRYGYALECDVRSGVSGTIGANIAYWFDGARYVALISCLGETTNAFTFQSNLDNDSSGYAQYNIAIGNTFTGLGIITARYYVSITGSDYTEIIGNSFTLAPGEGGFGVMLVGYASGADQVTSSYCTIDSNYIESAANQRPIHIDGIAGNPITGLQFVNNTVVGYTRRGYFVDANCTGALFSGNTYPVGTTAYGYATAGDEATIVANNTLQ